MTDDRKQGAANSADAARRERERKLDQDKSGTQEKRPNESAKDDIRGEAAERAANAAIVHRPAG